MRTASKKGADAMGTEPVEGSPSAKTVPHIMPVQHPRHGDAQRRITDLLLTAH